MDVTSKKIPDQASIPPLRDQIKKLIPNDLQLRAGIDTSTLIRLFYGSWRSPEVKLYQNFFDLIVSGTVYKEFLNFQKGKPRSFRAKDRFLEILGARLLPFEIDLSQVLDPDAKIVDELHNCEIELLITDNVKHFRGNCEKCGIYCLDGVLVTKIFTRGCSLTRSPKSNQSDKKFGEDPLEFLPLFKRAYNKEQQQRGIVIASNLKPRMVSFDEKFCSSSYCDGKFLELLLAFQKKKIIELSFPCPGRIEINCLL